MMPEGVSGALDLRGRRPQCEVSCIRPHSLGKPTGGEVRGRLRHRIGAPVWRRPRPNHGTRAVAKRDRRGPTAYGSIRVVSSQARPRFPIVSWARCRCRQIFCALSPPAGRDTVPFPIRWNRFQKDAPASKTRFAAKRTPACAYAQARGIPNKEERAGCRKVACMPG
jgi:hypothetical protein